VREQGLTYSQFIQGVKAAGIELDRKVMAAIAFDDPTSFAVLVEKARAARPAATPAA
jgi:large subunit ribosomal protein L20